MSHLVSSSAPISGAHTVKQYAGFGILGSAIPTTGDSGGSPVANDGVNANGEYHWRVETPPSAGALTIYPDLSFGFDATGLSNAAYTWVYRLYEDGVSVGTAMVSLVVGAVAKTATTGLSAAVRAAASQNASLGAAVLQARTATAGLSSAIRVAQSAAASLATAVRAGKSASVGIDASIDLPTGKTITASASAAVRASSSSSTTLSAAVRNARSASANLAAAVRIARAANANIDTAISRSVSAGSSLSASVRAAFIVSAGLTSAVRQSNAAASAVDALIVVATPKTATASLSAALAVERQATASLSAAMQAAVEVSAGLDAYIETAVFISALDLQRLTEIWARMELDPTRPLSTSISELTVGTITQAIGTGGAVRTGALLPAGSDPATMIGEIWQRLGLDPDHPLQQTETTLTAGSISCTIAEAGGVVTVTRQ